MHILNMFMYLIGAVVLLVSLITATALMDYYEWKDRR